MSGAASRPAWVAIPSEADLGDRRPKGHPYDFGFLPSMARLLAAHPQIGPHFVMLFSQIMFAPGALSRAEKELVAGTAAAAQDCFY